MEKNKNKRRLLYEMDNTYIPARQRTYKIKSKSTAPDDSAIKTVPLVQNQNIGQVVDKPTSRIDTKSITRPEVRSLPETREMLVPEASSWTPLVKGASPLPEEMNPEDWKRGSMMSKILDSTLSNIIGNENEKRTVQDEKRLTDYIDTFPKMDAKTGYVRTYTDETGLDQAYANSSNLFLDKDGTLYVSGTKGGFFGSEWIENYRTMGVPLIAQAFGIPLPYSIEDNARYTELDNFMKEHPGMVKNFVGHSKGSAVIHRWMQNHPEFTGQSRLYATPYEDVLGKDAIKTGINNFKEEQNSSILNAIVGVGEKIFGLDDVQPVKGEQRIAANFDLASLLDRSAERYDHQNPFKYITSGGPHDYHEGRARFKSGFNRPMPTGPFFDRPEGKDPGTIIGYRTPPGWTPNEAKTSNSTGVITSFQTPSSTVSMTPTTS